MAAPQGVNFDGTNDYLTRGAGLTDAADSKLLTVSFWFKSTSATQGEIIRAVSGTSQRFVIRYDGGTTDLFRLIFYSGATVVCHMTTGAGITISDGAWHHLCFSIDLADTSKRHIYFDDVSSLTAITYTNTAMDFTLDDWAVGGSPTGGNLFAGDLAQLAVRHRS